MATELGFDGWPALKYHARPGTFICSHIQRYMQALRMPSPSRSWAIFLKHALLLGRRSIHIFQIIRPYRSWRENQRRRRKAKRMKLFLDIPISCKLLPLIKFHPVRLPFLDAQAFRGGDFAFGISCCLGVAFSRLLSLFVFGDYLIDKFLEFGWAVGHGVLV